MRKRNLIFLCKVQKCGRWLLWVSEAWKWSYQENLLQSCFIKSNIPYRLRHDQVTATECFIRSQQRNSESVCAFNAGVFCTRKLSYPSKRDLSSHIFFCGIAVVRYYGSADTGSFIELWKPSAIPKHLWAIRSYTYIDSNCICKYLWPTTVCSIPLPGLLPLQLESCLQTKQVLSRCSVPSVPFDKQGSVWNFLNAQCCNLHQVRVQILTREILVAIRKADLRRDIEHPVVKSVLITLRGYLH